jgi:putative ABC transport system permease protein
MQFISESIILAFVAHIIAMISIEFFLPFFNDISGKEISVDYSDYQFIAGLMVLVVITGILAGSYPAFVLSSFKPVTVLKGKLTLNNLSLLRNFLVVFQFSASAALIISTAVIYSQMNFIKTKNIGLNKEQVISIALNSNEMREKARLIKNELLTVGGVLNASVNRFKPGDRHNNHGIRWEGQQENESKSMFITFADEDFIKTMQIEMIEGEGFEELYTPGGKRSYILNQSALRELGWETGLNKGFTAMGQEDEYVAGVCKDFNFRSLHHEVAPFAIVLGEYGNQVSLRIKSEDISKTISSLRKKWEEIAPNLAFEYHFFDEDFNRLYIAETTTGKIVSFFTILSIFIACLGLFGLASYSTEQRTKEIGIRKALGASVPVILKMLSKEIILLLIISNLIAWPAAYLIMDQWLADFAYKVGFNIWVYIISGLLVMLLAVLSVGYKALKAAAANPVDSLRYE